MSLKAVVAKNDFFIINTLNLIKDIEEKALEYEDFIMKFLYEESHSFGFKPLYEVKDKLIEKLDIYGKEYYNSEELFSWFCYDNDFGKNSLSIYEKVGTEEVEFIIGTVNDLIEYLHFLEKKQEKEGK